MWSLMPFLGDKSVNFIEGQMSQFWIKVSHTVFLEQKYRDGYFWFEPLSFMDSEDFCLVKSIIMVWGLVNKKQKANRDTSESHRML